MKRDELIDALRGFALFGILAVNIQCFLQTGSAFHRREFSMHRVVVPIILPYG